MAEIPIRRKEGRNIWPLLLGLIVLAAVLWFVVARQSHEHGDGRSRRLRRGRDDDRADLSATPDVTRTSAAARRVDAGDRSRRPRRATHRPRPRAAATCSELDVSPAPDALGAGEVAAIVPAARLLAQQRRLDDQLRRLHEVELLRRAGRQPLLDLRQLGERRAQPLRRARDRRRAATSPRGRARPPPAPRRDRRAAAPATASPSAAVLSGATFARSRATRSANTSPSSSEFDASRFAPCTPVRATSPTA